MFSNESTLAYSHHSLLARRCLDCFFDCLRRSVAKESASASFRSVLIKAIWSRCLLEPGPFSALFQVRLTANELHEFRDQQVTDYSSLSGGFCLAATEDVTNRWLKHNRPYLSISRFSAKLNSRHNNTEIVLLFYHLAFNEQTFYPQRRIFMLSCPGNKQKRIS